MVIHMSLMVKNVQCRNGLKKQKGIFILMKMEWTSYAMRQTGYGIARQNSET